MSASALESDRPEVPLQGWTLLGSMSSALREGFLLSAKGAAPAETVDSEQKGPLPNLDDLINASVDELVEVMGFSEAAAEDFAALSVQRKTAMVEEVKAILNMTNSERQEALAQISRKWPRGPYPKFSSADPGPDLLPKHRCLPYARIPLLRKHPPSRTSQQQHQQRPAYPAAYENPAREILDFLEAEAPHHASSSSSAPPPTVAARPASAAATTAASLESLVGDILGKRRLAAVDAENYLEEACTNKAMLIDGDLGVRFASEGLSENDYRGERLKHFRDVDPLGRPVKLIGKHCLLCLSKTALVSKAHKEQLLAGAEIIRTNTRDSSASALQMLRLKYLTYDINKAAAQLAKAAAADITKLDKTRPRLVAGLVSTPSVEEVLRPKTPKQKAEHWARTVQGYNEQLQGLLDGGSDLLFFEFRSSGFEMRALLKAAEEVFADHQENRPPLLVATELLNSEGATLFGASAEAFADAIKFANPFAVIFQSKSLHLAAFERLGFVGAGRLGLLVTNDGTSISQSPADLAALCLSSGGGEGKRTLSFLGGGSGVGAPNLAALSAQMMASPTQAGPCLRRRLAEPSRSRAALVDVFCSPMGSSSFAAAVDAYHVLRDEDSFTKVLDLMNRRVRNLNPSADYLEVNVDSHSSDGLVAPGGEVMGIVVEEYWRTNGAVPLLLSSSDYRTIEEGLKRSLGKCVVNALCLMVGEEEFLRMATICRHYGAAVVVLALDEYGPAKSLQEKLTILKRAYALLVDTVGISPHDVWLDVQVLPLGSGESARLPSESLEAISELRDSCPGARLLAGVQNLSLAFRQDQQLRGCLHAAYLKEAVRRGLDVALVDVSLGVGSGEEEAELASLCEALVRSRSAEFGDLLRKLRRWVDSHGMGRRPLMNGKEAHSAAALSQHLEEEASSELWSALPEEEELLTLPFLGQNSALTRPRGPKAILPSPAALRPLETIVQATGTFNGSLFQFFGSKAHAAHNLHRLSIATGVKRSIMFSSISVYMGQGGGGPTTGASSFLDALAMWERHQGLNGQPIAIEWGAIGEIGLRRKLYGTRDVFAQYDLGQKLISPRDTLRLMREIVRGPSVPELIGLAWLDQNWQNQLSVGTGEIGPKTEEEEFDRLTFLDF